MFKGDDQLEMMMKIMIEKGRMIKRNMKILQGDLRVHYYYSFVGNTTTLQVTDQQNKIFSEQPSVTKNHRKADIINIASTICSQQLQ